MSKVCVEFELEEEVRVIRQEVFDERGRSYWIELVPNTVTRSKPIPNTLTVVSFILFMLSSAFGVIVLLDAASKGEDLAAAATPMALLCLILILLFFASLAIDGKTRTVTHVTKQIER